MTVLDQRLSATVEGRVAYDVAGSVDLDTRTVLYKERRYAKHCQCVKNSTQGAKRGFGAAVAAYQVGERLVVGQPEVCHVAVRDREVGCRVFEIPLHSGVGGRAQQHGLPNNQSTVHRSAVSL